MDASSTPLSEQTCAFTALSQKAIDTINEILGKGAYSKITNQQTLSIKWNITLLGLIMQDVIKHYQQSLYDEYFDDEDTAGAVSVQE
jgi:hypothetical protein